MASSKARPTLPNPSQGFHFRVLSLIFMLSCLSLSQNSPRPAPPCPSLFVHFVAILFSAPERLPRCFHTGGDFSSELIPCQTRIKLGVREWFIPKSEEMPGFACVWSIPDAQATSAKCDRAGCEKAPFPAGLD